MLVIALSFLIVETKGKKKGSTIRKKGKKGNQLCTFQINSLDEPSLGEGGGGLEAGRPEGGGGKNVLRGGGGDMPKRSAWPPNFVSALTDWKDTTTQEPTPATRRGVKKHKKGCRKNPKKKCQSTSTIITSCFIRDLTPPTPGTIPRGEEEERGGGSN